MSASAPKATMSRATLPAACTASQTRIPPFSWTRRAISAIGCSTPVSLFANCTATSAGPEEAAREASSASRVKSPLPIDGKRARKALPRNARRRARLHAPSPRSERGKSPWRPLRPAIAASSAVAMASVPPLVKITPASGAFARREASWRAVSTRPRAARPSAWTEEGLPVVASASTMRASTSARIGAVAFQSR